MRYFQILTVVTAAMTLSPHFAFAQAVADYPNKPVRLIAASSPGGGIDVQARMFAQKMSENLKQQFTVDNRPGAGDTIGTALAAKSAPDGYTVMMVNPTFTTAPALYPSFPYDPIKDFAAISLLVRSPFLLAVHPSLPAKSVKELIALAKAKPGALDDGVAYGGFNHLIAAYFASEANIKLTFVPYKGGGQVINDAIGGQIHMLFSNVLAALPHVRSGRLRALGVTSGERSSVLPELPTIAESGVRGYDVGSWAGWVAPAGTPAAIVNKLSAELAKAVKSQDLAKKLAEDGGWAVGSTPEQFQQLIATEIPRWRQVVKESGMRVE